MNPALSLALLLSGAPEPPDGDYSVIVAGQPDNCAIMYRGETYAPEDFEGLLKALPDKEHDFIVRARVETPYVCVGGAIYRAQRAGFSNIGFESLTDDQQPAVDEADHPEARPYDTLSEPAEVDAAVNAALSRARESGKRVILVLGANWCHDSRGLAGWFETPRFRAMLAPKYEVVFVDAGTPQRKGEARNQHLVKRFRGKKQKNTPYVMVLSPEGSLLNRRDARSWRNAASRSADEIYAYFAEAGWQSD